MEESVLETLKIKADFHNFKPRPFNMREFYDRTGHSVREMLLSCRYRGSECSPEDFRVVSLSAPLIGCGSAGSDGQEVPYRKYITGRQKQAGRK